MRTYGLNFPGGTAILPRSEHWAQLIYAARGVMTVHAEEGSWVVPPHRALWVPPGLRHEIEMPGPVAMRTLYLSAALSQRLPKRCSVVNVSPLLRELILYAVRAGVLSRRVPEQRRIIGVLLDQLRVFETIALQLPVPRDERALRLVQFLRNYPDKAQTTVEAARIAAASPRTLERIFRQETAMSFGRWRQRFCLLRSLESLAAGMPVARVAERAGYRTPSAFIAMFKRELGATPSRYFQLA